MCTFHLPGYLYSLIISELLVSASLTHIMPVAHSVFSSLFTVMQAFDIMLSVLLTVP